MCVSRRLGIFDTLSLVFQITISYHAKQSSVLFVAFFPRSGLNRLACIP